MTAVKKFIIMIFAFALLFGGADIALASHSNLHEKFSEQKEVLTFIHPVISEISEDEVCSEILYQQIVSGFEDRIGINFNLLGSINNAEIEVISEMIEYSRPEILPVENITDIFSRVWSFFRQKDRGRLRVLFTVKTVSQGDILFRREVTSTISRASTEEDDFFEELSARIVKAFFRAAFSTRDDIGRISN